MTTPSNDTLWLTQAAYDRFQQELEELTGIVGPSQETEGRIQELRRLLRQAEVADKPDDGLVEPGMMITVRLGDDSPTTFLLAPRELLVGDHGLEIDVYSPTSPLGEAIAGKHPGDAFEYRAPNGSDIRGRILAAVPFRQ